METMNVAGKDVIFGSIVELVRFEDLYLENLYVGLTVEDEYVVYLQNRSTGKFILLGEDTNLRFFQTFLKNLSEEKIVEFFDRILLLLDEHSRKLLGEKPYEISRYSNRIRYCKKRILENVKYRWKSPHDWLFQMFDRGDIPAGQILVAILDKIDPGTIQDVFQKEMEESGYFEKTLN